MSQIIVYNFTKNNHDRKFEAVKPAKDAETANLFECCSIFLRIHCAQTLKAESLCTCFSKGCQAKISLNLQRQNVVRTLYLVHTQCAANRSINRNALRSSIENENMLYFFLVTPELSWVVIYPLGVFKRENWPTGLALDVRHSF